MHEVGLMQSALDLALEAAAKAGATRIHRLTLRVGALAGVEPEALAFAFEVVTRGTAAEGAHLEMEAVSILCNCCYCSREFESAGPFFDCPDCGRPSADVLRGYELELAHVEVSQHGS